MAAKQFKLIQPEWEGCSASAPPPTDWDLCFLCEDQVENQLLLCPANARNEQNGYELIAHSLVEFSKIQCPKEQKYCQTG